MDWLTRSRLEKILHPFFHIYNIYYEISFWNQLKYHSHQISKNIILDKEYLMSIAGNYHLFFNYLTDLLKNHFFRNVANRNKIQVDIQYYDEDNKYHRFFIDFLRSHSQEFANPKTDVNSFLFIILYDQRNRPLFASALNFSLLCNQKSYKLE